MVEGAWPVGGLIGCESWGQLGIAQSQAEKSRRLPHASLANIPEGSLRLLIPVPANSTEFLS